MSAPAPEATSNSHALEATKTTTPTQPDAAFDDEREEGEIRESDEDDVRAARCLAC